MSIDWVMLVAGGAGAIVLSAVARHMPSPEAVGKNIWYTWAYNVVQTLLANPDLGGLFRGGVFKADGTQPRG